MDFKVDHGLSLVDEETYEIILVTPKLLELFWGDVKVLLEQTRETWDEYDTIDSIHEAIHTGKRHLWVCVDLGGVFLAGITCFDVYPVQKVLRLMWLGGSHLSKVLWFLKHVEHWALMKGATKVETAGRKGWQKLLEPYGYKYKHVLLTKMLKGK